jgi:ADP-dependent phosphofructokinase/glucokinase
MGTKIAMGFHSAVDFELQWNAGVIEALITKHDIKENELPTDFPVATERDMVVVILTHLKEGTGGEYIPETNKLCKDFASYFTFRRTIGGTATRAAIALSKIGYETDLSMCCYNDVIRILLPPQIHQFPNTGLDEEIYPHVILSYPGGARIRANGIDITTPRENRIMFSNDEAAIRMEVSKEFSQVMSKTEVFLLGCFSEVLDAEILKDRIEKTAYLLEHLSPHAWAVLEDGCYINKDFRYYVHDCLRKRLDVLSMNEDELQEYIGGKIDILDVGAVRNALSYVHKKAGIPVLVVHSAYWALAYGAKPERLEKALLGGICLSATRFCHGDAFGVSEYESTQALPEKEEGVSFCREMSKESGGRIVCFPAKDLRFVKNPTVVGLGDFFAGGLLPGLLYSKNQRD